MPEYGPVIVTDEQLKILKTGEKDKNLMAVLSRFKSHQNMSEWVTEACKYHQSLSAGGTHSKALIKSKERLTEALATLIAASNAQQAELGEIPREISQYIQQGLRDVISQGGYSLEHRFEIERVNTLLRRGLFTDALAFFDMIYLPGSPTLTILRQQLKLIVDNTSPLQLENLASTAITLSLSEALDKIRLYNAAKSFQDKLKSVIFDNLDTLFDIVENSAQIENRDRAIRSLIKILREPQKEEIIRHYKVKSLDNKNRLAFIEIINDLAKNGDLEKNILIANFFLTPFLSLSDKTLISPIMLLNLPIDDIFQKLNDFLDQVQDEGLKRQIILNGVYLIQQMVLADRFGMHIPDNLFEKLPFLVFKQKMNAMDPELTTLACTVLEKALEDPARNESTLMALANSPYRPEMPVDMEQFFRDDLAGLKPDNYLYQHILASCSHSLFLMQVSLWLQVKPGDFHQLAWTDESKKTGITQLIHSSKQLTEFIIHSIHSAEGLQSKRERALFFANLMNRSLSNPDFIDFGTAYTIYNALNSISILPLDLKKEKVMKQARSLLHFENDYRQYYKAYQEAVASGKNTVPILAFILKEIQSADELKSKEFPRWLKRQEKNYEAINRLINKYAHFFQGNKSIITSSLVQKIQFPTQTQSAPARMESSEAVSAARPQPLLITPLRKLAETNPSPEVDSKNKGPLPTIRR